MKNCKILNQENLLHNLRQFDHLKICAMVKANAYGHGLKEIVQMAQSHVECFGVVNVDEAILVRKLTDKPVLICAKTDNFKLCKKYDLDVVVDDEQSFQAALKKGYTSNLHLKINCGMNRFGVKSVLNAKMINAFLEENHISLKSISTHFPITENKRKTMKNYETFMRIRSEICQNVPICFGGSGIIKYPFDFDMIRVGIGMYGYGSKHLRPVMRVQSFVSKIFRARKGEFVGYGNNYKVKADSIFAVVPLGYGDGLRRNLSGKFFVKIGGKRFQAIGNICMDCFFVRVDESVNVGDAVEVMSDAAYFAKKSHTIPYEILTGFSEMRGQTVQEQIKENE